MSVATFNPQNSTNQTHLDTQPPKTGGCGSGTCGCAGGDKQAHEHHHEHQHPHEHNHNHESHQSTDDIARLMPTTDDLKRPHSEKELIDEAMAELNRPSNLIASSRQQIPNISVNGVVIDPTAIAQEVQYHPANSQDEALFLSAQALVIRELLKQAVYADPTLGESAWQADEETAISDLIDKNVHPTTPHADTCRQLYEQNRDKFVTPPLMTVRHILLASPPDAGDERITLKQKASQLIEQLQNSPNRDAEFIELARQYSACPSKEEGGELGEIVKGQTVPEFEQAVFGLPVGLSVNPIETRYGVHIVEVLSREDGQALSFEQAMPMIANELTQQSFHHGLTDFLFKLSHNADIQGINLQMNEENVYRG
ncbi:MULTISPECIES: peptidylprolyl isomerase [unclassified Moraxella]|uniref:peptidylprolyl isomerase n=1 Tax=unclassified Moraxella TaxID=2685852 RepID=UPI003AF70D3B